jgi:excinuclease ABC subunit C
MAKEDLKPKAAAFPDTPGVYLMKDAQGVVLYVGKAKSLRSRIASYFQEGRSDDRPTITAMLPQVADVEVIEAESEVDALLMEARLIKDVQPKYNADLRDSKLYPYLEIARSDDFPAVYVTRQRDDPRSRFYGPFTDTTGLRHAVRLLQRVFKFRTCSLEIRNDDPKRRFYRPCLLYSIDRCTAPCGARVSRTDYLRQIVQLKRFIEGKRARVLRSLQEQMRHYSETFKYEKAADIRDRIRALEALAQRGGAEAMEMFPEATAPPVIDPREGLEELQRLFRLPEPPRMIEGVDAAHLSGESAVGAVVTFLDGRPYKAGYRRFRIQTVQGIDDFAMIGEVVHRRFRRLRDEALPLPHILLIDGGKGQLHAAMDRLRQLGVPMPKVVAIAKREEILYHGQPPVEVRLKRSSPALRILQYIRDEAHRFGVHYHHILRGKTLRAEI